MGWSKQHFNNIRSENEQWKREIKAGKHTGAALDKALDIMAANNQFIETFEGPDGYNEPDRTK